MPQSYSGHGVRFEYPESWELDEQRNDFEIQLSIDSPETSFWSLSLILDKPNPVAVADAAVNTLRELYEEFDVYNSDCRIDSRETISRDIEFVCLELVNSAYIRAFQTERFTVLIVYQGTDHELEETRETLEQISASLVFEDEPEMLPGF